MAAHKKSLKSLNLGWLWGVVAIDAIALVLLAFPGLLTPTTMKDVAWLRALGAAVAPVVVLLLTSLLSSDAKAVLVFWRLSETLPGHRAFSVYALKDARINMDSLRNNVGAFPENPREQNTMWYKLYKKVESEVTVAQAHRHYLLFRDLAAISLLLAPISVLLLYSFGASTASSGLALALLVAQYAATAVAARNNGIRLVTNVLALHAVKRRV